MHVPYKSLFKLNVVKIFPFLNPYLPQFSDPPNPENVRFHSSNSNEIASPFVKMRPNPAAYPN